MLLRKKLLYSLVCLAICGAIKAALLYADGPTPLQNAQRLVKKGDYVEALIAFAKIRESDAGSQVKAEAAVAASEVLTLLGQFDEAVIQLEAARAFLEAPDTPQPFREEAETEYAYRLANGYALAGEWEKAQTAFEAFIKTESNALKKSDVKLLSARRKVEWMEQRIFSPSRLAFRLTASLLAFLLAAGLCVYIFARDPLSYLNLSLSFFMFGFALWQLADAIRGYTLQPETALFWSKVLVVGIVLVCIANLNFILVFLQRRKNENFETLRWFFVILPPATLIALAPTNLYMQGADVFYWDWEAHIHRLTHKLFFLYIALYVIYGITMISRANVTISRGLAAKPITYMFFTLSFIFTPSLVAVILAPLSKYNNYVIGASSLTVIVMATGLMYSIRRYRLIDVDVFLSKGLVYFVLTGLLLGAYVLLVNLFFELLQRLFQIQTSFWAYVSATLIVSVLFQPTRNRVQSLIDRLFHKEQNIYHQTLLDFSQAVTTILDLNRLYRLLVTTVADAMQIDKARLLIETENGGEYEVVAAIGVDDAQKSAVRALQSLDSARDGTSSAIKTSEAHFQIAIPLQREKRVIGVLQLGRKYSGKPFVKADREILKILANQAAVAVANARLVNQLRRADQLTMLGRLSAGTAHEVRNPLLAIKGAAQFLRGKFEADDEAREFVSIITEESDRINQLVTQFLDYARPAKPRLYPMDITAVLDRTLTLLSVELRHAKVECVKQYAPDLPHALGDERQLGRLFLNLILNALEAMPQGGILGIQAHRGETNASASEFCEIQISDTGVGVSKEEQTRIFEPFYTSKEHGLGLGLAIVKEIVSQHEGAISVTSEKGKGTTFTVRLRIAPMREAAHDERNSMPESENGKTRKRDKDAPTPALLNPPRSLDTLGTSSTDTPHEEGRGDYE